MNKTESLKAQLEETRQVFLDAITNFHNIVVQTDGVLQYPQEDDVAPKLPKGCRARNNAILKRGAELLEQWRQGNKSHVRETLLEYPTSEALAICSYMMVTGFSNEANSIAAYLREAA